MENNLELCRRTLLHWMWRRAIRSKATLSSCISTHAATMAPMARRFQSLASHRNSRYLARRNIELAKGAEADGWSNARLGFNSSRRQHVGEPR